MDEARLRAALPLLRAFASLHGLADCALLDDIVINARNLGFVGNWQTAVSLLVEVEEVEVVLDECARSAQIQWKVRWRNQQPSHLQLGLPIDSDPTSPASIAPQLPTR